MIGTERLLLRPWREADVAPYHALGCDPDYMRFLGPPLTLAEAATAAARQRAHMIEYGSCFWAVEHRDTEHFIGYCGIKPGPEGTPIAGLPEIGWGIMPSQWRQGYAAEAARATLEWAWAERAWPTVHAIAVPDNIASWRLMERIGMTRVPRGDFDHPHVAADSPLMRHIRYSIDRPAA